MEGSVNSNGVDEEGNVTREINVAVGIAGRGVVVGIVTAMGEVVCSNVDVAGAQHAEKPSTNIAIARKIFFICFKQSPYER